ncbi:TPA: anaerobic glycerol-3-phosphate dehydrogenase subunit A [Pasteurella multocida]|uniref:anaerobic glycerol-3-phosphate dehydrogenase subunit A n=1 Tax=Pasteurella multocida TaxID=747 RepID=UPI000CE8FD98|nr:anaerobic glycerol-3-phosphate dehydrogenase subunit A [Pasteurella multocida]AWB52933.1 anaerobic glycerol-3-phosphate dehydrogenase subunit A [Pasteurella multocida]MDY0578552.1 anaerobic glycerol-3-phosphate dehydrogenase subunit A [Pasteurella multocida]MEB3467252.1 anaerobic glycerol-3-phosphate dehydrogenase subunit A [Pasteurella multocida]MEB3472030.1 anaerobic glycerol-3-phosphate dehydrogenase subunit A [Pasteurella multocida]MEB3480316.1 anaerobic glycerol-3-phosphate dehydrogena
MTISPQMYKSTADTSPMTTDVIIIGGGATGAGIARDCALRGVNCVLLERRDIATGATGRNHGLLHSGARYAVNDPESAKECIEENKILRRIARHCVDETEGLFITLPEDDLSYQKQFIQSCTQAGIDAIAIDPDLAKHLEPSVNPDLVGAVVVPDGSIDPFRLTASNMLDATENGARIFTYCEVKDLIQEGGRVIGVSVYDHKYKMNRQFFAPVVVNASGIWGQGIAEYADLKIRMFPAKGALLVMGHRINKMVINRCRKPADADILVPGDTICVIGTTSSRIPYDQIDNMVVTPEEVDILFREGEKLAPSLRHTRVLRAYAGVRPLVATDDDPSGRNVSRGIVLLDHAERDGLEGFVTITGGKLMTYRLMAEWATDLVCKKLNKHADCVTATQPLPGSSESRLETNKRVISLPSTIRYSAVYRHGSRATRLLHSERLDRSLVCECEAVTAGEVRYAVDELSVNNLVDLRRRTRVGMGTCQAELCACRAAGLMARFGVATPRQSTTQLASFMEERWRGIEPIAWGEAMREADFTSWVYYSLLGLNDVKPLEQQAQQGTDDNEF